MDNMNIRATINRFYSLIKGKPDGTPDTRYKSWEYCHRYFSENRGVPDEATRDYMALHLAFYLASWGMYRGSSYLLQRDYKTHTGAVEVILNLADDCPDYGPLWNYSPKDDATINKAAALIFDEGGAYWKVKNAYENYEGCDDNASDTLVTKILMGTFGCIPAFDRFLKRGISIAFPHQDKKNICDGHSITQSIGNGKETFIGLSKYVQTHSEDFKIDDELYPPMKCLDMYLWELGYEYELYAVLYGKLKGNKAAAIDKAVKLGFGQKSDTPEAIAGLIQRENNFQA